MNYLLDTNVVSEWIKPRPHPSVIHWLAEADEDRIFLSVITLAEVRYGIERMPIGERRNRFSVWLRDELTGRFANRILPINPAIAEAWGQLIARTRTMGRTVGIMDAFLSATAEIHEMTLVTRNAADFRDLGFSVFNPWTD